MDAAGGGGLGGWENVGMGGDDDAGEAAPTCEGAAEGAGDAGEPSDAGAVIAGSDPP